MAPSLPKTYKAAIIESKGANLAIKDFDLKEPGKGEVLVKVLACGVCHSDDVARQGLLGDVFPRVPGHEIVGDVVAVGENVTRFKGGERVGGPWHGGKQTTLEVAGQPENSGHKRFADIDCPAQVTMELAVPASGVFSRRVTTVRSTA